MQGQLEHQPALLSTISLEDFVPKNHILRKIDKLVDFSFVQELTKDLYCSNNGRPSIPPEQFIRMVFIGYFFGIKSDRKLCEELQYNLAYRWYCLIPLEKKVPSHSSFSKIRDRLGEKTFLAIFKKVLALCQEAGLVPGEEIITDGSLIKADASIKSMINNETKDEDGKNWKKKVSNKTHTSKTDPDSTLAGKGRFRKDLSYNVHNSIDASFRVIVDSHVTTGSEADGNVYINRLDHIEDDLGLDIKRVVADRGYGSAEILTNLKERKVESYIPLFSRRSGQKWKDESNFLYDKESDIIVCPLGSILSPMNIIDKDVKRYRVTDGSCSKCPQKRTCLPQTHKTERPKYLNRNIHQELFEEVEEKMRTDEYRKKYKERAWKVEGIFAEAKNNHNLRKAKYRGLSKVQIQAYMTSSVQNIKRLVKAILIDLKSFLEDYFGKSPLFKFFQSIKNYLENKIEIYFNINRNIGFSTSRLLK